MSYRFDNRSVDEFKKHIKFSTLLENYFFTRWVKSCERLDHVRIENPRDNGVDNTGEFIEKGKTSGADYMVNFNYRGVEIKDMPLEVKWVPTYGKLTLKIGDLKAYIRENAAILFIYNAKKSKIDLRIPKKDYNFDKHIGLIESVENQLKWGVMIPQNVKNLLDFAIKYDKVKNINYMGGKPGIVINQNEFSDWFFEENWSQP
jgi:hypothetical protein